MCSIKNFTKYVVAISVLLLFGYQTHAQTQSRVGNTGSNTGNGMIVGKAGAAFKINPNGQCHLVIPDWLFERVKKNPQKYSLKITVRQIPQQFLEAKQPTGGNQVQSFALKVTHGTKSMKGDFTRDTYMPRKQFQMVFPLSNTITPNVDVVLYCAGEPVPGGELYIELEPDDEP